MRHVRSILYALVLAPVLWVLIGVGFNHDLTTRGRGSFAVESFTGLLLLLLAGAAYGILVFAPISPAGPFLAGLAYLGIAVWALAMPDAYAGAFPASVTKDSFDLSRPGYGLAALLAVPLIATALSARRWAKYEPPVLPIIGVIGRARGAAAVAGTPVAVLQTQVIGAPPGSARAGAEPTAVLRLPTGPEENTTVLSRPSEQTTVAAGRSGFAAEIAAQSPAPAVRSSGDEPSTAIVISADETVDVVASPAGADDRTVDVVDTPDEDVTEAAPDGSAAPAAPAAPAASSDEEPTVATPVADEGDDRTQAIRLPDSIDGDRTQLLRLPVADDQDRTQALRLPVPAPVEPTGDATQAIRWPAEPAENGERAQPAEKARKAEPAEPGERAQPAEKGERAQPAAKGERAEPAAKDERAEPAEKAEPADQDRTQVIRTGLVKPPGDGTEVLKLPVAAGLTPSIAAQEQPDLTDDPTSRLIPAGNDRTAENRSAVLNRERPPDEIADDTTRLDIPAQRRPTADEN